MDGRLQDHKNGSKEEMADSAKAQHTQQHSPCPAPLQTVEETAKAQHKQRHSLNAVAITSDSLSNQANAGTHQSATAAAQLCVAGTDMQPLPNG